MTGQEIVSSTGLTGPVAWSPDGRWIASPGAVVDAVTLNVLPSWQTPNTACKQYSLSKRIAWSPDGTRVVAVCADRRVEVRSVVDGSVIRTFTNMDSVDITAVDWSPDGKRIAAAGSIQGDAGSVQVWDAATGEPIHTFTFSNPLDVAWSADSTQLAIGGFDSSGNLQIVRP